LLTRNESVLAKLCNWPLKFCDLSPITVDNRRRCTATPWIILWPDIYPSKLDGALGCPKFTLGDRASRGLDALPIVEEIESPHALQNEGKMHDACGRDVNCLELACEQTF
jgi:hypothetical protein